MKEGDGTLTNPDSNGGRTAQIQARIKQYLPVVIAAGLFVLAIGAIRTELKHYSWQDILQSLHSIPRPRLLSALGLMVVNYGVLTGYDTLAMRYLKQPLPWVKTSFAGFVSYAISNSVGLALLSGSAIRYRLYESWNLTPATIALAIAFCNLSFWIGLFAVGGITFLFEPLEIPAFLHLPFHSAHPIGWGFLAIIGVYLVATSPHSPPVGNLRWHLPKIPLPISLMQIVLTATDWMLAASILFVLLPPHPNLGILGFFGIYLLGQVAGIISNVPGGLGVFETVILYLLTPQYSSLQVIGALLAYRVIYYWLPFCIAGLSYGGYEAYQHHD